jgi:hypothetical protein
LSAERWRRPVVPLAIEQQSDQGLWLPDGRVLGGVSLTLASGDVERVRAGYVCAKCLEPFEQAWPERCHVCGAPVRREQASFFAREYGGEQRLGPSVALADEIERLPEERAKEAERNDTA